METSNQINKKNNLIGVVVFLILLVLGLSGYIVYDKLIGSSKDNKLDETVSVKEDSVVPGYYNKLEWFDGTKCINNKDFPDLKSDEYEVYDSSFGSDGRIFNINKDKKSVHVQVRYDIISPDTYNEEDVIAGTVKNSDDFDLEFDKKVNYIYTDACLELSGFVFVFEDGTLEYIDYIDIQEKVGKGEQGKELFVTKPIEGVSDVVRVEGYMYRQKDAPTGTGCGLVGYKKDGSFYDLSK